MSIEYFYLYYLTFYDRIYALNAYKRRGILWEKYIKYFCI